MTDIGKIKNIVIVVLSILSSVSVGYIVYSQFSYNSEQTVGYESLEQCIIEKMKGQQTYMYNTVVKECRRKYNIQKDNIPYNNCLEGIGDFKTTSIGAFGRINQCKSYWSVE
jgi:hypothetical protein